MATRYVTVDDVTGRFKRGNLAAAGATPIDQDYDVGGGGQANFTVTQTFSAPSLIDVSVNGIIQREGSSYDFQRNTSLNRLEFNYTIPQNAWVRIRVWA